MRVLIIEDEEALGRTIRTFLERCGHEVSTAGDGVQGLEAMHRRPIHAVLCDVRMPRLDGLEFAHAARQRWPDLPIALMSGYFGDQEEATSNRLGVHCMTKPLDLRRLLQYLEAAHAATPHEVNVLPTRS